MNLKKKLGTGSYRGRGRILRIKEGYNPNSSSLGSIVFSFPGILLAVPVVFSAAAAFLARKLLRKNTAAAGERKQDEDQ